MPNSNAKGKRGEREFAEFLRNHGDPAARRGVQYCGDPSAPDVVSSFPVHWEVKRTESLRIYDALDQAEKDTPYDSIPAVAHRRNGRDWVVILDAKDFLYILGAHGAEGEADEWGPDFKP